MATARRRQNNYAEIVLGLIFFAIYMWLAKAMEGWDFDTIFIALFCTFLSVFIARCVRSVLMGK